MPTRAPDGCRSIERRPDDRRRDQQPDSEDAEQVALLREANPEALPHRRQAEQRPDVATIMPKTNIADAPRRRGAAGRTDGPKPSIAHEISHCRDARIRSHRFVEPSAMDCASSGVISTARRGGCLRVLVEHEVDLDERASMQGDAKPAQAKVTYATMSADQMSELHRDLDAAIEEVKKGFGQSHPMFSQRAGRRGRGSGVGGTQPDRHRDHLIGRHAGGHARADAGRNRRRPRGVPRLEPPRLGRARPPRQGHRPPDPGAPLPAVRPRRLRDRQEPPRVRRRGRGGRGLLRLLLRPDGGKRRVPEPDGAAGVARGQPQRAPPLRRVRHHRAVQLPRRPGRRADGEPRSSRATRSSARPQRTPRWPASASTSCWPTCCRRASSTW